MVICWFECISTIVRRRVICFCEDGVREEMGSNNIVKWPHFKASDWSENWKIAHK